MHLRQSWREGNGYHCKLTPRRSWVKSLKQVHRHLQRKRPRIRLIEHLRRVRRLPRSEAVINMVSAAKGLNRAAECSFEICKAKRSALHLTSAHGNLPAFPLGELRNAY